jgi:hypothetical protein
MSGDSKAVKAVISGHAKREPGIHNHDREYGFSDVQLHIAARAKMARPGMTSGEF